MTLHDAVRSFRWDAAHDYREHDTINGVTVAIYGLGLYEADLARLKAMIPGLKVLELRRVDHDHDAWLRVDLTEGS